MSGMEECPSKQFDTQAVQHRMVEMCRVKDVKRDGGKTIKFDTLGNIAESLVEEHEAILCYVPRKREGQEVDDEPGYVVHKISGPLPKPSEGLEAQIQKFHNAHFGSYTSQLSSMHHGSRSLGSGFFDFITSNAPNEATRQPSRVTFKFPPSTEGDTSPTARAPPPAVADPLQRESVGLLECELEDVEPLLSYRPRCNSPRPEAPGSPPTPAFSSPVNLAPSGGSGAASGGDGDGAPGSEYSGADEGGGSGGASDSDSDNSMPPAGWFTDVKSDTGTAREGWTDSERGGGSCTRRSASADATDLGYESDDSDDVLPQDSYLFQPNSDTQSQTHTRQNSSSSCKGKPVLKASERRLDSQGSDSDDDMLPAGSYMFQPAGCSRHLVN